MTALVEAPPCSCGHSFAEHIDAVGCKHEITVQGDDLTCVCDQYAEA